MSEETNTVNKNAFFEKQMIGGCIVEVFGTYEEDVEAIKNMGIGCIINFVQVKK